MPLLLFGPSWPVLGWILHYIILHYITLHYITLHYITLHCITLHYITLTRAGCYLTFGTALALLLPERFMNFEAKKRIIFFGVTTPKRKAFLCHSFKGVLVWRNRLGQTVGTERYYCMHCMKIAENELITLHQTMRFFSVHKSLMSVHCRKTGR
jgi:hypothetical protein